ncbi:SUMF1/EgtB/PvdO family nonheme iron enzyme [Azospirillum rugosum]|uniref:Formylglycine-generating enzyme required for sulfatase activity n=1 Tax=Azospirillum rugosum TaxID=416170 RepID=A0ABS4SMF4_9PROT|nr:SUMF1/EgtB/PvdO family nonheme iron enzyme [Azospirillum rugosum]MBP2293419.1 formylglycine-generating enzyme required for sulfatase activity [Azospirillum rugosum]MDQ0530190.1 formylglycine-generating enzyme required for sulfatase activity [Azospirillum rugosum]
MTNGPMAQRWPGLFWWMARTCLGVLVLVGASLCAVGDGWAQKVATPPATSSGSPEKRIALVVGIGKYEYAPELQNPRNDAKAIGDALRKLQFDVDERFDLDGRTFERALRDFGIRASQADVAVIFYAGHGIQVGGNNYIVPSDARLERERDLVYEAMPLNLMMGELSQARKLGILMLDACRNNPFVDRLKQAGQNRIQVNYGFARIDDTPSDTLVAMATRADQLAEDGQGDHSPYSAALLQHLETPGLELSLFFRNVRDTVRQSTNGRQEPYIFGSLGATPFYFNPRPPNRPPVLGELKALEVTDRADAEPLRIGRPTDPDDDQLFAQVSGLPRGGSVRIGDRVVLIGDYLTVEQLAATSFKPDATVVGDAGSFDFTVMDGRGGIVRGGVRMAIKPSNRAPVVMAERTLRAIPNPLNIEPPVDPDGDALTITVTAVPERGKVKDGATLIRPSDRLAPETLNRLTFDPEEAAPGPAGAFAYLVEDGKGGRATGTVKLDIGASGTAPQPAALEESIWQMVKNSNDPADFEAFLRLFANGSYAGLARQKLGALNTVAKKSELPVAGTEVAMAAPAKPEGKPESKPDSKPEAAKPEQPKLEPVEEGTYVTVADANLRSSPANNATRLANLPRNTTLRVMGRVPGANWYHVTLGDGSQGYVFAPLVHMTPPADRTEAAPPPPPEKPQPEKQQAAAPPPAEEQQVAVAGAPSAPGSGAVRNHSKSNSFQDCPECPVMVRIQPGSFSMGSDQGDRSEKPVRKVTIAKPFALGAYEVTVAEFRACVDGGGCPNGMPRMTNPNDNTPIHNISWQEAQAYAKWLSQKTGQRYRLPTEAEWEYAARGGTTGRYWWGNEAGVLANCQDCGGPHERLTPASVGSYKPNPFGLHDMNGSVAEWVADCWHPDYSGAPSDGSAWVTGDCRERVLRGGSWRTSKTDISDTARLFYDVDVRYLNNGMRVLRELN